MSVECRANCVVMRYCESQKALARAVVGKLTDLQMASLDRFNSLPDDSPARTDETVLGGLAATAEVVNFARDNVDVISTGIDQRLVLAESQCPGSCLESSADGVIISCGGFSAEHLAEINGDQIVIDRIARMVGFLD